MTEEDTAAYERCRAVFCGGSLYAVGQDPQIGGVAVLLQEGILAWLQYKNSLGTTVAAETESRFRQPSLLAFPEEELVILFATMMGGNLYEPEF